MTNLRASGPQLLIIQTIFEKELAPLPRSSDQSDQSDQSAGFEEPKGNWQFPVFALDAPVAIEATARGLSLF
ncbi:hypothetical protein [Paraburkholderia sabiae]|uniref:hypothetical protein n=1 Tax=Paraburkholderia sabiae TaxID=273251 RepID=UPI001CC5C6E3|nr:hypothetical protein [Paraburkholderia sabiae]